MPAIIERRRFLAAGGAALTWALAASAQQGDRVRRIGVLMQTVADDPEARIVLSTRRCSWSPLAVRICICGLLCILWLAVFVPRAGAEQNSALTFRIEVSQPEYERTGGVWICSEAQFLQNECRGTVPLVMFEEPIWATIEISIIAQGVKKFFELRASLDGVRVKYKASSKDRPMALENDGSFAGEIQLDQAEDMLLILPVVRPIPEESFGLIIKRTSSKTDHK